MSLWFLLAILILIGVGYMLFSFLKSLLKALVFTAIIGALIAAILSFLVLTDLWSMESDGLVFILNENTTTEGLRITPSLFYAGSGGIETLGQEESASAMESGRVFVARDRQIFSSIPENLKERRLYLLSAMRSGDLVVMPKTRSSRILDILPGGR